MVFLKSIFAFLLKLLMQAFSCLKNLKWKADISNYVKVAYVQEDSHICQFLQTGLYVFKTTDSPSGNGYVNECLFKVMMKV